MRNTLRDVIIHFVIGAILCVVALFLFLFKFNFKAFPAFMAFGPHFSVLGLVAAIVAVVLLVLAACGTFVYGREKKA
ncbi:MAG: hypothetical protein II741_04205 [Lachnospiraceae bacterium]|jgi:hypothetical protein|nr:hypothetical protein [Lachnospiraceae bacterium]